MCATGWKCASPHDTAGYWLCLCNHCCPHSHIITHAWHAGYKAKTLLAGTSSVGGTQCLADGSSTTTCVGAYEIEACAVGTVSSWSVTTRSPAEPMKCTVCTSNTYAPRTGELVVLRYACS